MTVKADEFSLNDVRARQEIEYLQRWYARATDLIGTNQPDNIEAGREIYHRIFTSDASIQASDPTGAYFKVTGPDCLLYTSPSPRDVEESRMPSSA